tara:strand:- start:1147 stop:1728 length:582 start_codon:yes stop_codon:yes gene_type:complete
VRESNQSYKKIDFGFTIPEIIMVLFISVFLISISAPYAINWLRRQRTIVYANEMSEFMLLIKSEARRWGSSCEVKVIENERNYYPSSLKVNCESDSKDFSNIHLAQPKIPINTFQFLNRKFIVNPRGDIIGKSKVIFLFGYNTNDKKVIESMPCIKINVPSQHIHIGSYFNESSEPLLTLNSYMPNLVESNCR